MFCATLITENARAASNHPQLLYALIFFWHFIQLVVNLEGMQGLVCSLKAEINDKKIMMQVPKFCEVRGSCVPRCLAFPRRLACCKLRNLLVLALDILQNNQGSSIPSFSAVRKMYCLTWTNGL